MEACGDERSGYHPLRHQLGRGFVPPTSSSFLLRSSDSAQSKHPAQLSPHRCCNCVPKTGSWGWEGRDRANVEGSMEERCCSPLCSVSSQRAAQSGAWCPGGASSSSAPCSPSTRADTRAWHGPRAPKHAGTSWCWCEVGLPCEPSLGWEPFSPSSSSASLSFWCSGTPDHQCKGPQ